MSFKGFAAALLLACTAAHAQFNIAAAVSDQEAKAAVTVRYTCPIKAQLWFECTSSYVIPSGQRLVLHTINYAVGGPAPAFLRLWGGKASAPANSEVDLFFGPTSTTSLGTASVMSIGSHNTLLYFDQMPHVMLTVASAAPFENNIPVTLVGYLVKK